MQRSDEQDAEGEEQSRVMTVHRSLLLKRRCYAPLSGCSQRTTPDDCWLPLITGQARQTGREGLDFLARIAICMMPLLIWRSIANLKCHSDPDVQMMSW